MQKNVILRNRDVKLAKQEKIKEKLDLHSLHSLRGENGMCQCGGVPCTKNYTPPSDNDAKRCTLECCVGLHFSQQVVSVGDRSSCLQ